MSVSLQAIRLRDEEAQELTRELQSRSVTMTSPMVADGSVSDGAGGATGGLNGGAAGVSSSDGATDKAACTQRKLPTWRLEYLLADDEVEDESTRGTAARQAALAARRDRQSFVVVASLLDKPTNLGGICRTAEVIDQLLEHSVPVAADSTMLSISRCNLLVASLHPPAPPRPPPSTGVQRERGGGARPAHSVE